MFKESNFKEDIYLVYLTKCVSLFVTAAAIYEHYIYTGAHSREQYMRVFVWMKTYSVQIRNMLPRNIYVFYSHFFSVDCKLVIRELLLYKPAHRNASTVVADII